MKKIMTLLTMLIIIVASCNAAENEEPQLGSEGNGEYFDGKKVLVAYFSWGGTTRRMAEAIQAVTNGDIFEMEPVVPYPTSYTPCTEVALEERDKDARPAIKDKVADWDKYDIVFIGCPVWWHTAPMIISTFAESYDFAGKTVVPFCTYASTYRDETLAKIVDLTPSAEHLEGLGTTGSTSGVKAWIERISAEWVKNHPDNSAGISTINNDSLSSATEIYDLYGNSVQNIDSRHGVFIVRNNQGTKKILK